MTGDLTTRPYPGDAQWGIAEIVEAAGVKRNTVDQWRQRGRLPEPDGHISGNPWWWKSTITAQAGIGGNERTRMLHDLADAVSEVLSCAAGGWVSREELLPLAPQGRVVGYEHDRLAADTTGYDNSAGPAWDAGPSGKPDGRMLEGAIDVAGRRFMRDGMQLEEGYPLGSGRSFRAVPNPDA